LVSSLTTKRAFWLLDVALIVCIAVLAWRVFVAFTAPPPPISSSITTETFNPTTSTLPRRSADYYAAMGNSRMFGDAGVVPGATGHNTNSSSGSLEALPATALTSLKLLGTAVGTEGMSTAVIENETSRSADVYRVGDKVAALTVLEQILPKKVILNRDGTREVLTSSVTEKSSVATPPPRRGPTPRTPSTRIQSRPNYTMIERREWQDKDPYELLGKGKVTPAWKDGRVQGLQLQNIADNEHAQRLGLKEGDIVSSVNGVKIRSVDEAISLAGKLQQAPVIRVEVMRDGKPQTLTYRLR